MMNALTQRLGIEFPLFQAGMGGVAGAELAAATATAGAGGVLGLYRMPPAAIGELLARTRAHTTRPFGVNLIPELMDAHALEVQIDAVLHLSDPSVYFTFFGIPDREIFAKLRLSARALLIMVGDVGAMQTAQAMGADAVILQGTEAGGHLLGEQRLDDLVTAALGQQCSVPLIGAGGIGSGHRFRELNDRGIAGCLCGTLFAATKESNAHPRFKRRLVEAESHDTVITDLFDVGWPGRRHRVLRNALTGTAGQTLPRDFIAAVTAGGQRHPLPRYSAMVPLQQTEGCIDEMAMYCGESVDAVRSLPSARRRVRTFIQEFQGV